MWIKICGIRDEQTAMSVCQLGPSAIGLNFYAKSARSVTRDEASRIAKSIPDTVERVGVFVNHPLDDMVDLVEQSVIHTIQLHGDETPEQIAKIHERLPAVPLFRAWRMDGESLVDLNQHLSACRDRGVEFSGCLIDSRVQGSYGGTGHTVSWSALNTAYLKDKWPPLIVAGGLSPDNVSVAIRTCHPWGVDVASGVESSPGTKNIDRVRAFIEQAKRSSENQSS